MRPGQKLTKLKKILKRYGSCLIAFSGGVDSALLLKVTSLVLPNNRILAVTADSTTYPKKELVSAKNFVRKLGVKHKIIKTTELKNKRFISNPVNRCYFCKKELFSRLSSLSKKLNLNFVLDGSTLSDKSDFRPGSKAKKEFKVRSPLQEAGMFKEDVRLLSRKIGLNTWNKPSLACLASRIPYGTKISLSLLRKINKAETILRKEGFSQVRLRHYDGLCRIEVSKNEINGLLRQREHLIDRLKDLGYNYITVDLEGYRSGSLNEVIK